MTNPVERLQSWADELCAESPGSAVLDAREVLKELTVALGRLERVAEAHHQYVSDNGMVGSDCAECGWGWPCSTYEWVKAGSTRDPFHSCWDPSDDETAEENS